MENVKIFFEKHFFFLCKGDFVRENKRIKTYEDNEMIEDKNLEWKEVKCQHIVQDEYIDFRRSDYLLPDGTVFGPYYSYSRRDYVVIVAIDEDGKYICVKQFRHGIKRVTVEFCAGGLEREDGKEYGDRGDAGKAESALDAAKRELMEETGYESDDWKFLLSIPSNPTIADNYANIFLAKNCHKVSGQNLDDTEFLNVDLYTKEEIDALIEAGDFPQVSHVMALLLAEKN